MITKITLSLTFLALFCSPAWVVAEMSEVKAIETWSGKLQDASLQKKFAPDSGLVADATTWEKLWNAWRPGEDLPKIDFTQNLVLVGTAPGPNQANMRPRIDDERNVKFVVFSTKIGGPGFGYTLMQIERHGVKTVNEKKVPTVGDATASATPKESITVTVVGTLRTGLVAIGGETTGTTITANGITWELEFGKHAMLRDQAEKLDGKKIVVMGTLERRAGVEVPERWIVTVSKLKKAGEGDAAASPSSTDSLVANAIQPGNQIRFLEEDHATIIDVTSESGLGKVTVERKSDKWPQQVHVRLHLAGLESFQVGNQDGVFEWSLASGGDRAQRATYRSGREFSKLAPPSPYYTEVKIVGGNNTIPLKDGYFDVPLPAPLLADNPEEITLRWIDFYRN